MMYILGILMAIYCLVVYYLNMIGYFSKESYSDNGSRESYSHSNPRRIRYEKMKYNMQILSEIERLRKKGRTRTITEMDFQFLVPPNICGAPTKTGDCCQRKISVDEWYCYQHKNTPIPCIF